MPIEVTKRAVIEAQRVMEEQQMEEGKFGLRVGVLAGGCSGFSYKLGFEEVAAADPEKDTVTEFHGMKVLVDKKSDLFLDGTVVDFHEGLDRRGFTFANPNSTKCCGCGSSFSCG